MPIYFKEAEIKADIVSTESVVSVKVGQESVICAQKVIEGADARIVSNRLDFELILRTDEEKKN